MYSLSTYFQKCMNAIKTVDPIIEKTRKNGTSLRKLYEKKTLWIIQ